MNRRQRRALASRGPVSKKPVPIPASPIPADSFDATTPETEEERAARLAAAAPPPASLEGFASPGIGTRRVVYPHPETGEKVVGYRKDPKSILYMGDKGLRIFTEGGNLAEFEKVAKKENLRLLSRQERRAMWREEIKRKKQRIAAGGGGNADIPVDAH